MVHLTDTDDALKKAFDAVEGEGFFDRQARDFARDDEQFKDLTIGRACEQFMTYGDLDSKEPGTIPGAHIYGNGGWNRYFTTWSGEIVYSASHGERKIAEAEAAGFKIWR